MNYTTRKDSEGDRSKDDPPKSPPFQYFLVFFLYIPDACC
jgi:hypothetical protein